MEKIKITKEQTEAIERLKAGKFDFKNIMGIYLNGSFGPRNACLYKLSAEDLAKALLFGYDTELPAPPELDTRKIEVSFNESDALSKNQTIFMKIPSKYCAFSFDEAKDIANTLNSLIKYHEDNVKQL